MTTRRQFLSLAAGAAVLPLLPVEAAVNVVTPLVDARIAWPVGDHGYQAWPDDAWRGKRYGRRG